MRGHRLFAAVYDAVLAAPQRAGLAQMRAELLAHARGRTLEIGAGTGLNLEHFPPGLAGLVLTEPDPFMAARLRHRLARHPPAITRAEVVEAPAERLPFGDESFDTVVSTLALCTVEDPAASLAEVTRVLAPGGRLLVLEHVRGADGSGLARWQDRIERPWGWVAGGCHPNRDAAAVLAAAGFATGELVSDRMPGALSVPVSPMIRGVARAPAG